jgi:endonuclease III
LRHYRQRIEALEAEQEALRRAITDPAFYRQDSDNIVQANAQLVALEQALGDAYARWET